MISGPKNDIDVKSIMEDIYTEIHKRNYGDIMPFSEVSEKTLLEDDKYSVDELAYRIEQTHRHYNSIQIYDELKGNSITKIIKRAIRISTRFFFKPFAEKQIAYNACVERVLDQIYCYMRDEKSDAKISSEQEKMYFVNHDELIKELTNKIMLLEDKVNSLEETLKKRDVNL